MLSAYRLFTYAVPPCWYNYAFIHKSRTSLLSAYRLFTYAVPPCWYNYAFYIKAALPCSVHTGSSHTLYLLAGTIMRFTSKPHFLAQCIQAIHIRCTSLLVQLCVLHQSRTSLLSAYRLFTYAVPPCWYNYAFYIKAALPCSVHTGSSHTLFFLASIIMRLHIKATLPCLVHTCSSHTLYLLAGTIMRFTSKPHFLVQCIQALHIRCTSLLVQLCVLHQNRTSLLSAYMLFTYAVPPCWYNYAFIHQSRTSLLSAYRLHTLYLLASIIMHLYIKPAFPCSVLTGSSHKLFFLASIIIRLDINKICISLLSAFSLFTYAVLPC